MTTGPTACNMDPEQAAVLVRAALTERYGVPVLRLVGGRVEVPAGNAVSLARETLDAQGGSIIAVVPFELQADPWFGVPADGLRLWRQHGRTDELVTELASGDPGVQVLTEHDGWQLVSTLDGATGWLAPGIDLAKDAVRPVRDLGHPVDADRLVERALELLDAPYVWGGTTANGVDCSGLIQRAAYGADSVWLPRHSTALLRAGRRIAPSSADRGDVLVLKRDLATVEQSRADFARRHPMHVALLEDAATAVHASRDAMAVVREPLASLRERYRILGVRRLDQGPEPSPGSGDIS